MAYKLFVYGTLRHRYGTGMAEYLNDNARLLAEDAWAEGFQMYASGIPFVVRGEGTVYGDIYEIQSDEVISRLDMYEGHPISYERQKIIALMPANGDPERMVDTEVWCYIYQGEVRASSLVKSGDFLKHIASRS